MAQSEAHDTVGELIAQMQRHIISEKAVLERYRTLARATIRDDIRYLLTMIAEEEERHHARMAQVTNALLREFRGEIFEPAVPDFSALPLPFDFEQETREMLAIEKRDEQEMRDLEEKLALAENGALWVLLVKTLIADTQKHQAILEFILEHSAGAVPLVTDA
ncbi:MAG: ferritin family protein [Acidimicrobiales bacterium]